MSKLTRKTVAKRPSQNAVSSLRSKATTNQNRIHIIPSGNTWTIKKEGASRATRVVSTKPEAIKVAKSIVRKGSADSIINHKKDGTFSRLK